MESAAAQTHLQRFHQQQRRWWRPQMLTMTFQMVRTAAHRVQAAGERRNSV